MRQETRLDRERLRHGSLGEQPRVSHPWSVCERDLPEFILPTLSNLVAAISAQDGDLAIFSNDNSVDWVALLVALGVTVLPLGFNKCDEVVLFTLRR